MSKALDKLAKARIMQLFNENENKYDVSPSEKEEILSMLESVLKQEVREEIKDELLDEEIAAMKAKVSQEEASTRRATSIKHVKNLLLDGFGVAFLVGLLVNQVTDIFSYCKTGEGNMFLTGCFIVALIIVIWLLIQHRLCDAILNFDVKRDIKK